MAEFDIKNLQKKAREIRRLLVENACRSKSPHVGSSLSCVDILTYLYFQEMNISEKDWDNRDIFILSKGHGALALYSTLTAKGIIKKEIFETYLQNDGALPGHLDRFSHKGIEASAGSLGHGFGMALGMAHGFKVKGIKRKVFALIGDGESQEGAVWEGALFASKLGADNFTAVLDYNNLQGYGRPCEICGFEPVADKWKAFGWTATQANGHDFAELHKAFCAPHNGKPKIIIAKTIKGKGVPFMEDELKWHYFTVTEEHKQNALKNLCTGEPE